MCIASLSFSGSEFLINVFLILCPSRMQVKSFSATTISWAYTLPTIERNKVNAIPLKRVMRIFIDSSFSLEIARQKPSFHGVEKETTLVSLFFAGCLEYARLAKKQPVPILSLIVTPPLQKQVLGDRVRQSPPRSAAPSGFRLVFRH